MHYENLHKWSHISTAVPLEQKLQLTCNKEFSFIGSLNATQWEHPWDGADCLNRYRITPINWLMAGAPPQRHYVTHS